MHALDCSETNDHAHVAALALLEVRSLRAVQTRVASAANFDDLRRFGNVRRKVVGAEPDDRVFVRLAVGDLSEGRCVRMDDLVRRLGSLRAEQGAFVVVEGQCTEGLGAARETRVRRVAREGEAWRPTA